MNKRLLLIMNGKGGVGKSFFAIHFLEYLKQRSIDNLAIDTDNENSTLKRFHPQAAFLDLSDPEQLDKMVLALRDKDLVVVDCRAASTDLLLSYLAEIGFEAVLSQLKARMTLVLLVTHEADSVEQIQTISSELKASADYVIVRNLGPHHSFKIFDESHVRAQLLKELHAREIHLPKMQPWLVEQLQSINLTAFGAGNDQRLTILNRQRAIQWQRAFDAEIDMVTEILLPEPPKPQKPSA